jgi:stage IV sporulation protein A
VITTDGSFGEISRMAYTVPEEKTINELKKLHKPFVVLVNSEKPYSDEAKKAADEISAKYHVTATTINCEQLKKEDIHRIMQNILMEFPLTKVEFYMPGWVEMLPENHELKKELCERIKSMIQEIQVIKDSPKFP